MWNDVGKLYSFYRSGIGLLARRFVRERLTEFWPDVRGARILGLGYATPYLRPFRSGAERVIALMPREQGILRWPEEGPNLAALCEDSRLPLPDRSVDKVLLVHAVEVSEALRPMLREVWRVMTDDGSLVVVVPSRRGLWARFERTPFGYGRPYTSAQMTRLLRDAMFTPGRIDEALFFPPFRTRLFFGAAPAWERMGRRWFPALAGVMLAEARKSMAAGTEIPARPRVLLRPAAVLDRAQGGAGRRAEGSPG